MKETKQYRDSNLQYQVYFVTGFMSVWETHTRTDCSRNAVARVAFTGRAGYPAGSGAWGAGPENDRPGAGEKGQRVGHENRPEWSGADHRGEPAGRKPAQVLCRTCTTSYILLNLVLSTFLFLPWRLLSISQFWVFFRSSYLNIFCQSHVRHRCRFMWLTT